MSSRNSKQSAVPEAREALNKFKMEAASEVGVDLKYFFTNDFFIYMSPPHSFDIHFENGI